MFGDNRNFVNRTCNKYRNSSGFTRTVRNRGLVDKFPKKSSVAGHRNCKCNDTVDNYNNTKSVYEICL